jgi:polar amino acid transport system substrate-binding protein
VRRLRVGLLGWVIIVAIGAPACHGGSTPPDGGGTPSTAKREQLAMIHEDGVLRVATDPRDKPQSWYDRTVGKWKGFDVEVAEEIATRLGVKAEFRARGPQLYSSTGSWDDGQDVGFSSLPVTIEQENRFRYTPAYLYWPASIAVRVDDTSIEDPTTDLNGKRICVGEGTAYESYLHMGLSLGDLSPPFRYVVEQPRIVRFPTSLGALDSLAFGGGSRCDAVIASLPTIAGYAGQGAPVRVVGDPLFYEPFAAAFSKDDPMDNASLVATVSQLIRDMHDDGTLSALCVKWYGVDLTTAQAAS